MSRKFPRELCLCEDELGHDEEVLFVTPTAEELAVNGKEVEVGVYRFYKVVKVQNETTIIDDNDE